MSTGLQMIFIEDDELVRRASVQSLQLAGFDVSGHGSVESAARDRCELSRRDCQRHSLAGRKRSRFARAVPRARAGSAGDSRHRPRRYFDGRSGNARRRVRLHRKAVCIGTIDRSRASRARTPQARARKSGAAARASRRGAESHHRAQSGDRTGACADRERRADRCVRVHQRRYRRRQGADRAQSARAAASRQAVYRGELRRVAEQMFESEMFGYEAGAFTGAQKKRVGRLEAASGGTLFLDEIESMPLSLQVKLLRVLQDGVLERLGSNQPVRANLRVVAAAKGDMKELVADGTFRQRLAVSAERGDDHAAAAQRASRGHLPLFEHFLLDAAVRYERPAPLITDRQRSELMQCDWPGNVRVAQRGGSHGARHSR